MINVRVLSSVRNKEREAAKGNLLRGKRGQAAPGQPVGALGTAHLRVCVGPPEPSCSVRPGRPRAGLAAAPAGLDYFRLGEKQHRRSSGNPTVAGKEEVGRRQQKEVK